MAKTDSITNFLKARNADISAVKANKALLALGLLAEKERPSSKDPGKMKKFKVLTEKGLDYGINKENHNSPEQTTPHYFGEKFDELLQLIRDEIK